LNRKDFVMRSKVFRKETTESLYWLRLIEIVRNPELEKERSCLVQESIELIKIFGSILEKSK
jgi:hypothetical protein